MSLIVALALGLAVHAAPAAAQTAAGVPPPATSPVTNASTTTDTGLTLGQAQNRMTVPVSINAAGPWGFIIDTGAERTVVSRELAATLGLQPGPVVRIVAMTGASAVPTVIVPSLSVSSVGATTVIAPSLEQRDLGAPGMLGIDALQGHRIDIDVARSVMQVKPSRKRFVRAGVRGDEVVVVARSLYGQLIVTDAHWRGRKVAVVIDTGSPVTIGNTALLRIAKAPPKQLGPIRLFAATGQAIDTMGYLLDRLEIGDIGFGGVPVAVADVAPFRRFGLLDRPALMLGMDTLRLFRSVEIDFANRTIRFSLPRAAAVAR